MNIVTLNMRSCQMNQTNFLDDLKESHFSICCLQAINLETYEKMIKVFPGAAFETHSDKKYGSAILYNPLKVAWMKNLQPEYKTSGVWKRAQVCSYFQDLKSQKIIRIMSVHLKRSNSSETDLRKYNQPKLHGSQELLYYHVEAHKKETSPYDVFVIAGCLNESPKESDKALSRIRILKDLGYSTDNKLQAKGEWIFCKSGKSNVELKPLKLLACQSEEMIGTQIEFTGQTL